MTGTNYNIEEKDTTLGRLDKTIDPSNAALRRSGSMASRFATSKGLGSSSINAGAGVGAFLDKAVDIAKTDSTNIVSTGNQNAVNNTQMRNTDVNSTTQKDIAKLDTDTQRAINAERIKSDKENLASDIESKERINSSNIDANSSNLDKELSVRERMQGTQLTSDNANQQANRDIEGRRIDSQEGIAYSTILADERKAEYQRSHELLLSNLDIASKERVEQMRMDYQSNADKMDEKGAAWSQYQNGLSSIDPNATAESQRTMFNRISDAFDARMDFIDGASYSAPDRPADTTTNNTPSDTSVADKVRGDAPTAKPTEPKLAVMDNYVASVAANVSKNASAKTKTDAATAAVRTAKQMGTSREDFVLSLKRNFNMSDDVIKAYLDKNW